jgi:hypothetical protein
MLMLGLELPWDYYMLLLGQVRDEVGRPVRTQPKVSFLFRILFYITKVKILIYYIFSKF